MQAGRVERRLTAIMAADMVGYSRLMEVDEQGIILRQNAHHANLIDLKFSEYGGRIIKLMGDGMLIEFPSVVNAVQCAVEIQIEMPRRELDVSEDQKIQYRIGINLGDIIIDGDDILGDGVNVALKFSPRLSLTNIARNPMFVRKDDVARLLDGLRKAGLPE
jgi:adenylate cyclase